MPHGVNARAYTRTGA